MGRANKRSRRTQNTISNDTSSPKKRRKTAKAQIKQTNSTSVNGNQQKSIGNSSVLNHNNPRNIASNNIAQSSSTESSLRPIYQVDETLKANVKSYCTFNPNCTTMEVVDWITDTVPDVNTNNTTINRYIREFTTTLKKQKANKKQKLRASPLAHRQTRSKHATAIGTAIKGKNSRSVVNILNTASKWKGNEASDLTESFGTAVLAVSAMQTYMNDINSNKNTNAMQHKNTLLMAAAATPSNPHLKTFMKTHQLSTLFNVHWNLADNAYKKREEYDANKTVKIFELDNVRSGHPLDARISQYIHNFWDENTIKINSRRHVYVQDSNGKKISSPIQLQVMTNDELYDILMTDTQHVDWFDRNEFDIPSFSYFVSQKPAYVKIDKKTVRYFLCRYCQNAKYLLQALQKLIQLNCICGTSECPKFVCKCGLQTSSNTDIDFNCKCECDCDSCSKCSILNKRFDNVGKFVRRHFQNTYRQNELETYLKDAPNLPHFGCLLKHKKDKHGKNIRDVPTKPRMKGTDWERSCKHFHEFRAPNWRHTGIRVHPRKYCGWSNWMRIIGNSFNTYCSTSKVPESHSNVTFKQIGCFKQDVCTNILYQFCDNIYKVCII